MTEQKNKPEQPELDDVFESFEKTQAAQRRKIVIWSLVGLVVAVGLFLLAFVFRNEVFGPPVDVEKGEKQVLAKTNDPQCRDMIAQVQQLGERYYEFEPTIEKKLLSDDAEAIQKIRDEVRRMQVRVDELEEYSGKANLRFDESRKQLDDWFEYVALELSFVDRLAREQLDKLKGDQEAGKKEGKDESNKDAGDEEEGVVVDKGEEAEEKEKAKANQKTPEERKQGALVALHSAFKEFRAWQGGSPHPCGAAEEGETPWTPDAEKAEGGTKKAEPANKTREQQ